MRVSVSGGRKSPSNSKLLLHMRVRGTDGNNGKYRLEAEADTAAIHRVEDAAATPPTFSGNRTITGSDEEEETTERLFILAPFSFLPDPISSSRCRTEPRHPSLSSSAPAATLASKNSSTCSSSSSSSSPIEIRFH